ncbi:hypothetical protein DL96DRAFT_1749530 [Flagelloscypha sp. PMI_526]|nr:hypothetical protein DL96DRAFT_1749530 [Flagelloscypha sp. PMI_526]
MERLLPLFPPELVRPILTYAARLTPETLSALLLVARHVHDWIEPLRYSHLVINVRTPQRFLRLLSEKSPNFLAAHVSVVMLEDYSDMREWNPQWFEMITGILRNCSGMVDLTFAGITTLDLNWLSTLNLRVLTLSFNASYNFQRLLHGNPTVIFHHLTHLELLLRELLPDPGVIVSQLPALTHVMFVGSAFEDLDQMQPYLLLPQIRRFVLLERDESRYRDHILFRKPALTHDDRLVFILPGKVILGNLSGLWKRRVLGSEKCDIWMMAERHARSRGNV